MSGATTTGIFSGLALWLVPSPDSAFTAAVKEESSKLRAANPETSSKEVSVHATLLAGLGDRDISGDRLRDVTQQAVEQWRKEREVEEGFGFCVGFEDVVTRGSYFQCILIALQKDPHLLRLNQIARGLVDKHFQPPPNAAKPSEYFPHISLLYSSISTQEAHDQINQMKKEGVFEDLVEKTLGQEEQGKGISFRNFGEVEFVAVDVYDCTARPEEWVKLHSIPL
ncbi:hypothetical protein NDA13_001859 [Ustilago tritici]|nr:hypothetical protein NDA13_001859 [Ustilago tritici]